MNDSLSSIREKFVDGHFYNPYNALTLSSIFLSTRTACRTFLYIGMNSDVLDLRKTRIIKLPIFPCFNQACFDGIVERVPDNIFEFFLVANDVVITFGAPE